MEQAFNGAVAVNGSGKTATGSSAGNSSEKGLDKKLKNIGTGGMVTATVGIANTRINQNRLGNEVLEKSQKFGTKEQTGVVTIDWRYQRILG